jgi:hypothetical protein
MLQETVAAAGCSFYRSRHLNALLHLLLTVLTGLEAQHAMSRSSGRRLSCRGRAEVSANSGRSSSSPLPIATTLRTVPTTAEAVLAAASKHRKPRTSGTRPRTSMLLGASAASATRACLYPRPKREFKGPAVHHGMIALGNVDLCLRCRARPGEGSAGSPVFRARGGGLRYGVNQAHPGFISPAEIGSFWRQTRPLREAEVLAF